MAVLFYAMCAAWFLSELWLAVALRAGKAADDPRDAGTFWLLWLVIPVSCTAAGLLAGFQVLPFPDAVRAPAGWAGIGLLAAGIVLRAGAILTLRRLFTVNVAIREGHHLVTTGLYRFVRHPSYSGSLLSFLGFGLALGTFSSLAASTIPVALAVLVRVRVEERALAQAFGDSWADYAARTARLVPLLY